MAIWERDAKENLSFFLEYESQGMWRPAKHLDILCQKLEAVGRGEITRLMIFMPPRHGKSEATSKKFPAKYLGKNPNNEIILCSYSADLSYDFSRIARNTIKNFGYLWNIRLAEDSSAVGRWAIRQYRGGLVAAGVGGPITGRGAHIAIIDDPFKNWQEAHSKKTRDNVHNWYKSTLRTRLAPKGAIILIMTRWHEDDLAGRLLKQAQEDPQADQWEVLSLPALAEENDLMGRQVGDALWPERYSKHELEQTKASLGSYLFAAMYQQRPQPEEGSLFKRSYFRYFTEEGDYYILKAPDGEKKVEKSKCWKFQTCDAAATENEKSDYFALGTWIVTPDKDLLLMDVFREKAETTKHKQIMKSQYQRWKPSFQGVENKTFGLNIIQDCKKSGLPIRALKADTDKTSRARPVAARYELGAVYHRQGAPWLTPYEDELVLFPNGANDDQVDIAAYAGIEVMGGNKFFIGRA